MNKQIITGNMVETPTLKTTTSGINTTRFKVAVQRQYKDKNGQSATDFFTVVAWRQTADFCCRYLTKGRKVAVEGSMECSQYTDKNGANHTMWELKAERVEGLGSQQSNANNAPSAQPQQATQQPDLSGFTEVTDDDLPF